MLPPNSNPNPQAVRRKTRFYLPTSIVLDARPKLFECLRLNVHEMRRIVKAWSVGNPKYGQARIRRRFGPEHLGR